MSSKKEFKKKYEDKIKELQVELVRLQDWVIDSGSKIAIIFEGRDAAGKGGTIKRITENLNPRFCKIVALAAPTEREKTQWYFQRYVPHLPAAGEIVIFDRSWYNRAGVERVMGFCTNKQYVNFLQTCPEFERMIISSGTQLIKYWFSVSAEEQMKRFNARANDPTKGWKLSPMDLESVKRWDDYSRAKDNMFEHTDTQFSPWFVVESDNKKKARINCISHLLGLINYSDVVSPSVELPNRVQQKDYERPPRSNYKYVPDMI
ncbi:MAG: polyphosphate kinase 2 [Candidatus Marinimicrobia bacterium]|nr:polyphosphate kinase 2 [Candidatus Neomarinimicrobiota bacterium]|tara:strand:+ start:5603 stop:6388 length:786 start_codon:yes stop_codon:yes gene_type:complete